MNNTFKLGRSIALLVPFYRKLHKKREEIFSNKIIITMVIDSDSKDCSFINVLDRQQWII
jgi:hypothetical protein